MECRRGEVSALPWLWHTRYCAKMRGVSWQWQGESKSERLALERGALIAYEAPRTEEPSANIAMTRCRPPLSGSQCMFAPHLTRPGVQPTLHASLTAFQYVR